MKSGDARKRGSSQARRPLSYEEAMRYTRWPEGVVRAATHEDILPIEVRARIYLRAHGLLAEMDHVEFCQVFRAIGMDWRLDPRKIFAMEEIMAFKK